MIIKKAVKKSLKTLMTSIPIMFGILLLISMINVLSNGTYSNIFTGSKFLDPLIGALAGSLSFGIPITSYVVGGELRTQGVGLLAVTAFILSWTTVGVAMLPLEAKFFGFKFALYRNIINFVFSIIVAILTVTTLNFFV
ncbi:MAG: hypothetical protein KAI79_08875 [Bacteroidales bacterium]|nr:hypothetical protein [Bacteroidales bacterium]